MDHRKIMQGVRLILEGVGEDLTREGLKETPRRVAEMCEDILFGINQEPELTAGFSAEVAEDVIILRDIPFYSLCEHHLLPFFGKVHLAYIPRDNKVTGFSNLTSLIDTYSRRLQLQERLTGQIAQAIMDALQPSGVLVVLEAQQLCVSMRGAKKDSVRTITQAVRGEIPPNVIHLLDLQQ